MNIRISNCIIIVLLLLILTSCGDIVISSKTYITKPIETECFEQIYVEGNLDVVYMPGEQAISVYGSDNVLENVVATVVDNSLHIKYRKGASIIGDAHITVYVSQPIITSVSLKGSGDVKMLGTNTALRDITLDGSGDIGVENIRTDELAINLAGSGDIEVNSLQADQLNVKLKGSGDISLSGTANQARYELNGSGDINAEDMIVNELSVILDGSGDIDCYARETLSISRSGSGEINYQGPPSLLIQFLNGNSRGVERND